MTYRERSETANASAEPLREKLAPWFARFGGALDIAADEEHNWRLALDALNTSSAAWAVCTKELKWADATTRAERGTS